MKDRQQLHRIGLQGERGLILAVISQAAEDLNSGKHQKSAAAYFEGSTYKHHLELLGLPPSLKPEKLRSYAR